MVEEEEEEEEETKSVRIVDEMQLLLPVRRGSRLKQACAETSSTRWIRALGQQSPPALSLHGNTVVQTFKRMPNDSLEYYRTS